MILANDHIKKEQARSEHMMKQTRSENTINTNILELSQSLVTNEDIMQAQDNGQMTEAMK